MAHPTPMYQFLLTPRTEELSDRLDSRMLADVGLDRFGNPVDRNDVRLRSCQAPVLSARRVFSIVHRAWQRLGHLPSTANEPPIEG